MRKVLIISLILFSINSFAQLNTVGELIRGGVEDGQKLMKSYLYPYEKALGYSTVDIGKIYLEPKEEKGFHLGLGIKVNSIFIASNDLSFDVNPLNLTRMEPANSNIHITPTLFGDTTSILMKSKDEFHPPFKPSQATATFSTPQGIGFHTLPIPELQIASSFHYTQLIISGYILPYKNVTLIGYNLSINSQISSFFELTKSFPIQFEISAGYGGSYQEVDLDVQPDAAFEVFAKGPYDNQKFLLNLSGYSVGLGANYKILDFIIFSNLYYHNFKSRTQVLGNYPVNVKDPSGTFGANIEDVTDPIDYSRNLSGMRVNIGAQYNFLKILYLKADYSLSSYNCMGIALGLRI